MEAGLVRCHTLCARPDTALSENIARQWRVAHISRYAIRVYVCARVCGFQRLVAWRRTRNENVESPLIDRVSYSVYSAVLVFTRSEKQKKKNIYIYI